VNTILRAVLLIWILGYLFVSCVPLLTGHLVVGGITFVVGLVFFRPWLAVALVLVTLVWLTRPRAR
jgi:hypothetical protein